LSLDEKALRRPEFAEGVAIRLSDGQEWTLPRPLVSGWYPRRGADGRMLMVRGFDQGAEYDDLTDAYVDLDESDVGGQICLLATMAAHLLQLNYSLTDADLKRLLRFGSASVPGGDSEMWGKIAAVALGNAPKPTPVGEPPA